jgi:hypothetical protein
MTAFEVQIDPRERAGFTRAVGLKNLEKKKKVLLTAAQTENWKHLWLPILSRLFRTLKVRSAPAHSQAKGELDSMDADEDEPTNRNVLQRDRQNCQIP